jgi:hypothetical protein
MRVLKFFALLATLTAAATAAQAASGGWGPETPHFNLEAILRPTAAGPDQGFGHVKFRQPNESDAVQTILLDVWVRDLAPSHDYSVQRATDTSLDGHCAGTNWTMPTLGTFTTDDRGTGRAALSRDLPPAVQPGATFDIRFRVIDAITEAVVLQSGCYEYTVRQ